jgi:hypothetical protein
VYLFYAKYKRDNKKPSIEESQTIQWPKEKGQTMIYETLNKK